MPITDKELSLIGKFKNLEKLNLNFTNVTSGLSHLQSLHHLKSLSLSGTRVTSLEVTKVLSMPELRELFIWNTSIPEQDQLIMTNQHKDLSIVWKIFHDDKLVKLSPPSIGNDGVLKKNEMVVLKHVMPGAIIRYTLDGSTPDSLNGQTYKAPIPLESTANLKAYAYKQGWLKSDTYETICFTEGYKADQLELFTKPDLQYPGEGTQTLVDGKKGAADLFKDPLWMGFRENACIAGFDFGKELRPIKSMVISYGKNTGASIFPPAEVQVWAGDNKSAITLVKTIKITQPTTNEPAKVDVLIIPLTEKKTYFKLVIKPVGKLPAWHSSKGQKGWFFVDEIFFN
jgi:hypothetical protein